MSSVLTFSKEYPGPGDDQVVNEAAATIRRGGLVVFPTETVYGIGCDPDYQIAVHRLYRAKGRPRGLPLTLHVCSLEMAEAYVTELTPAAIALSDAMWPGPLTIILPRSDLLHPDVVAGMSTVGLRMPRHEGTLALIRAAGIPIAATSANQSGGASAALLEQARDDLGESVDLYVDGGRTERGIESTVIDLSAVPFRVLRQGAIPIGDIAEVLADAGIDSRVALMEADAGSATPVEEHGGIRIVLHSSPQGTPESALRVAREVLSHHGSRASVALHECALVPAQLASGLRHGDGSPKGDSSGSADVSGLVAPAASELYDELRRLAESGVKVVHAVESPLLDDAALSSRLRRLAEYVVPYPPVG